MTAITCEVIQESTVHVCTKSVMSKKKLIEFEASLGDFLKDKDDVTKVIETICRVLNFDPERNTYSKEIGKQIMQRRKQRAEELGISQYKLLNHAKYKKKGATVVD